MGFGFTKERRAVALVALLAISFAQAALFAHVLSDAHDTHESCEVCLVSERLADAIGNTEVVFAAADLPFAQPTHYAFSLLSNRALTMRARGPPESINI